MKVQVTVPEKLYGKLKEVCEVYGFGVSEYIRLAVREKLYKKEVGSQGLPPNKSETPVKKIEDNKIQIWEDRNYMPVMKEKYQGFCNANRAHPFEKGKVREIFDIIVYTAEDQQYFKGASCKECIDWVISNVIAQGGRIE